MTIIIDSNEARLSPQIKELIASRFQVSVQHLESADYVLPQGGNMKGSIGIERKQIADLLSSLMDGRLFKQVNLLCDTYEYPVLLIEGSLYPFLTNPSLLGAYVTLVYSYRKLRIAHTRDVKGSVAFIKRSAVYAGPTGEKPPAVRRKEARPSDIRLAMLQVIEGVGPKLSDRIIRQVPSLFYSCRSEQERNSLIKSLLEIRGVSESRAKLIASVFSGGE